MKGSSRRKLDQQTFMAQVRECRDKGYLLSSKKIGSGAFSKVYLAYATQERMQHNPKLASDLRGKRHTMVRQPASSSWPWAQGTFQPSPRGPCPNPTGVPPSGSSSLPVLHPPTGQTLQDFEPLST